ncbi:hypothetical protein C7H79_02235 [Nitrosomonas supralitoralis]|uniref:Uncharacterized protein n=1 Tax=Nitrosomonas supralitoralis TaxID=2116706 RepID=A0A2P7NYS6_9PROT|nr:hypothetical protein C7H79_02235 [Nitrosomonas supralitoralis]
MWNIDGHDRYSIHLANDAMLPYLQLDFPEILKPVLMILTILHFLKVRLRLREKLLSLLIRKSENSAKQNTV